jgi:4-hydroxy-4-methyl-2-oxoglutarate aldolase
MSKNDPYELAKRLGRFLRVTDVAEGLDAVGRPDLTLMDPEIRPLWMGIRFWGPAVTERVLPTNRTMPIIDKKDALRRRRGSIAAPARVGDGAPWKRGGGG